MFTLQLIALFALLGIILAAVLYTARQARRGRQAAEDVQNTLASHGACLSGIAVAVKSAVVLPSGGGPTHPTTPK